MSTCDVCNEDLKFGKEDGINQNNFSWFLLNSENITKMTLKRNNTVITIYFYTYLNIFGTLQWHTRQVWFGHGSYRVHINETQPKCDMQLKCTKNIRLGINHTQSQPKEHHIIAISSTWLDITGYQDNIHSFWLAYCELYGLNLFFVEKFLSQLKFLFLSFKPNFLMFWNRRSENSS